MPELFTLETDNGNVECRIITSLYSEEYKHHYLVYEYVNGPSDEIYVSIYNPDVEDDYELSDVVGDELEEVKKLLDSFEENVSYE